MTHVKCSPNQQLSEDHKYWAEINSRLPLYALLNRTQTDIIRLTTDRNEAYTHGNFSTYPIGTYYHDEPKK